MLIPFLRKIYYRLNSNYQDIISFKDDFQYKLDWNNEKYEIIKQKSFLVMETSFNLINKYNEKEFWLLCKNIEDLYLILNKEITIIESNSIEEEIFYKYLIRLKTIIGDINYLQFFLKNKLKG